MKCACAFPAGIIEYNYQCVKEGLQKILELRKETKEAELQQAMQEQMRNARQEDVTEGGTPIPSPVVRV